MKETEKSTVGYIHSLESFGLVDGPGVRFVVFLQGCKYRCKFCHNPDTWKDGGEKWTAEQLYARVKRYKSYWGKNGGITVSGGEPLLQTDFLISFLELAKKDGIHTAVDTAGQPFSDSREFLDSFDRLCECTDLFILDLKLMDREGHKALTGFYNDNVLSMAKYLSDKGKRMWVRHVLVPGLTDSPDDLYKMREFIDSLKTVDKVEILPYHTLGVQKWHEMGLSYPLEGTPVPTEEQIKKAAECLRQRDAAP